jgi:hypothetical protein
MWQILNGFSLSTCFSNVSDLGPRIMSFPWPKLHTMHFPWCTSPFWPHCILAQGKVKPRYLGIFLNVFFGSLVASGMSIISQTSGGGAM